MLFFSLLALAIWLRVASVCSCLGAWVAGALSLFIVVLLSLCMALQVSIRRLSLAPAALQGLCRDLWSERYAQDYAQIMHGEDFAWFLWLLDRSW